MLAEWLERVFTTCPLPLREMGCLREMLGIRRRRRLHRAAWQPHCDRSRRFILEAMGRCRQRRKAVIFGSGWLHDVPVEELSAEFAEVVLVDLFHPWSVRRGVRRWRNVQLIAGDVTGTLEEVWLAGYETLGALPQSRPSLFTPEENLDLTVSLNLLSQLPCMPEQFLRRSGRYSGEAIRRYCRGLIEAHLGFLAGLPGEVALVSDVEAMTLDATGEVVRRSPTLYGVGLPWSGETWEWTLVPPRAAWPHHAEVLRVVAINDRCRLSSRVPGGGSG